MFLQSKSKGTDTLIEIKDKDLEILFNPLKNEIEGQVQEGQEEQDPEPFDKHDLTFASGEDLPRCWIDPDYRK